MCAISRMIKAQDPEAITVFIGPCLAKKSEVVDQQIEGNADYVLTYSEIRAIMKAKTLNSRPVERQPDRFYLRKTLCKFRRCNSSCSGKSERI